MSVLLSYWFVSPTQFQDPDFGGLSGGRVVRIAVHPDYQGVMCPQAPLKPCCWRHFRVGVLGGWNKKMVKQKQVKCRHFPALENLARVRGGQVDRMMAYAHSFFVRARTCEPDPHTKITFLEHLTG